MGQVGYFGQKWLILGKISGVVRFWAQILVWLNFGPKFWAGLFWGLRVWQFRTKKKVWPHFLVKFCLGAFCG